MGQFSMKITPLTGSLLGGNQQATAKKRYWYYTSRQKGQTGSERGERLRATQITSATEDADGALLGPVLARVDLIAGVLKIQIDLVALLDKGVDHPTLLARLDLPFTLNQNGRAAPIVVRTANKEAHRDPELIALIADARRWRDDLLNGRAASIEEITTHEGLSKGAVSRILPLAWVAPDIAAAIFDGRQPAFLTASRLRALPNLPLG